MSQSLKALMAVGSGSGAGWDIGQGRNDLFLGDPKNNTPQIIDYNGMKILFRPEGGPPYNLSLANYPAAYNKIAPFLITAAYKNVTNGNLAIDSYSSTVISTNNSGVITRSADSGDTWAAPSYPTLTSFAFRCIKYVPAWNKWIIPYTTNKCLISTDNTGATFTNTTVTGLTIDLNAYYGAIRIKVIGSVLVLCTDTKTFVTNNGTAWTEVMATSVGGATIDGYRKLTIGNNFFVMTFFQGSQINAAYSSDGYTWSLWSSFAVNHNPSLPSRYEDYGLVYDGNRWIHGTSFYEVVPPYGSYTNWSYGMVYSSTATPGTGSFTHINNASSSGGTVIFSDTPTIRYGHHLIGATTFCYENGGSISAGYSSGIGAYTNPSSVTNFIIANNRLPTGGEVSAATAFISATLPYNSSTDNRSGFTSYGNMYKDLQIGSPKFLAYVDNGTVSLPSPNNSYNYEAAGGITHTLINRILYTYLYIRLA